MKNLLKITVLLLVWTSSTSLIADEIRPYQETVNGITFQIDPRIELFNIIAMQAGHNGMTLSNISYKQECLNYFSAYKNLEAPKPLMETWKKGWAVDDPMTFLLYLDFDFNLKNGLSSEIIERGGGIEQINKLAASFKKFSKESDFQTFFNETQNNFYKQILFNVKYNFKDFKGVEYLENYYGEKCTSYFG